MKITVLDGTPAGAPGPWDAYLDSYLGIIRTAGHDASAYRLADMGLKYCTGCWSCWWATPGRCVHRDDMELIYRDAMASDILVFASPLVLGYVSAETKKAMDRLIPLLVPYLDIVQGEMHHKKRYPHYPALGVLVHREDDTDGVDLAIVRSLFSRFALNFRTELAFMRTTDTAFEEVAGETCGA